jgi:hypothetical protein
VSQNSGDKKHTLINFSEDNTHCDFPETLRKPKQMSKSSLACQKVCSNLHQARQSTILISASCSSLSLVANGPILPQALLDWHSLSVQELQVPSPSRVSRRKTKYLSKRSTKNWSQPPGMVMPTANPLTLSNQSSLSDKNIT